MVAKTVEAIIGAVFVDAGDDGMKAAAEVMKTLGLHLTGTFRDPPTP
jgi:dsRNA-specific ribonuclease